MTLRRRRAAQRRRRWLLVLLVLVAGFLLFGFFGLPPILKAQAEQRLTVLLHRPVTIGKVRVNPLELSVAVEDFNVGALDKKSSFLSWQRLYVNFEIASLVTGEWHFADIELQNPSLLVAINPDGSLNFSDLLAGTAEAKPAAPAAAPEKMRPVRIDRFTLSGARVDFRDQTRAQPFATILGPVGFKVTDFRTVSTEQSPYNFQAVTESGEKFTWQGWIQSAPFRSGGELGVSGLVLKKYAPYYAEKLGVDLVDGRLTVRGRYEISFDDQHKVLKLLDGSLLLRDLKLLEKGSGTPVLELPAVDVTGATADGLAFKANVREIVLQGGRLKVRREADGSLNLAKLAPPAAAGAAAHATPAAPVPAPDVSVSVASLKDWAVEIDDLAAPRPTHFALGAINATAKDLSLKEGAVMPVDLALAWQPKGTVKVGGTVSLQPLKADLDLDVDGFALLPLSAYLEDKVDVRLADGAFSLKGHVTAALPAGQPVEARFEGQTWLERLDLVTGTPGESFAGFSDLVVTGIKVATTPQLSVSLGEINLNAPYARVVVARDGKPNVAGLVKAPPAGAAPAPVPAAPSPAPAIEVSRFVINGGNFAFIDNSISPQVRTAVADFGGTLTGWSSANPGRGDVNLKAAVDGVGPVTITGKFDPLGKDLFVDARLAVQRVDLVPLSPYAGKYAGYELARGKLFVDVQAKVAERKLDVANVVTLDQFTWGRATNSPDATGLPVRLGVALLKDLDGKIVLDVPVQGSLDDPDFKIGKVVWRVIGNLLAKAATSPFALLGSMFGGGGEELGWQDFGPGAAEIQPEGRAKLETLVKALTSRPGLSLALEGGYDTAADTYALKRLRLEAAVRQTIWEERHAHDPATPPPAQLEITAADRTAMVKKLFDRKFPPGTQFGTPLPAPPEIQPPPPRPPAGLIRRVYDFITLRERREKAAYAKVQQKVQQDYMKEVKAAAAAGLPLEEMEGRLAEAEVITTDDLRALADARAAAVRDYFTTVGKIAPERLFLTQSTAPVAEAAANGKGPRVFLQLQ